MTQLTINTNIIIDVAALKLARTTDPSTSHEAAARVQEFRENQHAAIMEILQTHGPQDPEQIAARMERTAYEIRKRLPELQAKKMAYPNGAKTRTKSGRLQRVWAAVE